MKTIELTVYSFSELSEKSKAKAISQWYENEDYPTLESDLLESCKALLTEKQIEFSDINILYSLSCSQGDGLCFTGFLTGNGYNLNLSHHARYYYANSVDMFLTDNASGEELDLEGDDLKNNELVKAYFEICNKLEKEGYSILEYRMNNEEFSEFSDSNEYTYLENGKMYNE